MIAKNEKIDSDRLVVWVGGNDHPTGKKHWADAQY